MIRKSQSESCRAALADTGTVQNDFRIRKQTMRLPPHLMQDLDLINQISYHKDMEKGLHKRTLGLKRFRPQGLADSSRLKVARRMSCN